MTMETSNYAFSSDKLFYEVVELKGEKRVYVTGYISTEDRDVYDDIVTKSCMESMLKQLNNQVIKIDYEHEAFRDDPTILPVGKIVESKIDTKGLWVKVELNPGSPKFKALFTSIKKGFVDAFSIAFKPIKTTLKAVEGATIRMLEDVKLLNVALTGIPVNPAARIDQVMLKALKDINEVNKVEEKIKQFEVDLKARDESIVAKDAEIAELKSQVEKVEVLEKESAELKSKVEEFEKEAELKSKEVEARDAEIAELKSKVEQLEKEPVMKSQPAGDAPAPKENKAELKSILSAI